MDEMNKLGFEEFLKLQEAGFTNEQIRALNEVIENHASVTSETVETETPHAGMTEAPQTSEAQPQQAEKENNAFNEVMKMLGGIESKLIQQNIANSKQPEAETTQDILANIISPKRKEG